MIKNYAMLSLLVFCGAHGWSIFKPSTWFQETTVKGSSHLSIKTVPISGVTSITVAGIGTCVVVQDSDAPEQVTIEADDNILPYIEIIQDDNTLLIKLKDDTKITTQSKLVYRTTVKKLSEITLFGSVAMELQLIAADSLAIVMDGATRLVGSLQVEHLQATISGSSWAELSGIAKNQDINVAGTSQFDGLGLAGITADVDCFGVSSVYLNVTESICGCCQGVSSVGYKNNPHVNIKTAALSSVEKI